MLAGCQQETHAERFGRFDLVLGMTGGKGVVTPAKNDAAGPRR